MKRETVKKRKTACRKVVNILEKRKEEKSENMKRSRKVVVDIL